MNLGRPGQAGEGRAELHVVLPNDIDDPATPSGGNAYDRRVCHGLAALGWVVREYAVPGEWPTPRPAERVKLARVLAATPDNALVLLDGLIASAVPDVLGPEADRLRLVILVHLPLGDDAEGRSLAAARAVVATSAWTRARLLARYGLAVPRVHVALPGVDPVGLVPGSVAGSRLLCVAAVTPRKGHDVLLDALATIRGLPWRCVCAGALTVDAGFVARLRESATQSGLSGRVQFVGPLTGAELDAAYAGSDLLVLASRGEPYGMVLTEALARGIPVLAAAADGITEAVGHAPDGSRPGLLVPPGDSAALAAALRDWLGDAGLRRRLRRSARQRRAGLAGWAATARLVSAALERVPA